MVVIPELRWKFTNMTRTLAFKVFKQETLIKQNYSCFYCHVSFDFLYGKYSCEVDHLTPLSRGGKNEYSNFVLACQHCNQVKGSQLFSEFVYGN